MLYVSIFTKMDTVSFLKKNKIEMEEVIRIFLQEHASMSIRIAELERENNELRDKFTKVSQELTEQKEIYVVECEKKLKEAVESRINLAELMEDQEEAPAARDVNNVSTDDVKQVSIQAETVEKSKDEIRREYMRNYMKMKRNAKKAVRNSAGNVDDNVNI